MFKKLSITLLLITAFCFFASIAVAINDVPITGEPRPEPKPEPMTESHGELKFDLSLESNVFIEGTTSEAGADEALVTFSLLFNVPVTDPVVKVVSAEFTYDATRYTWDQAGTDKITANWPWAFSSSHSFNVDETVGTVLLFFSVGSLVPPQGFLDLAKIKFIANCQDDEYTSTLTWVEGLNHSYISDAGGNVYWPEPFNYDNGSITTADYTAVFTMDELIVDGGINQEISFPIKVTTNSFMKGATIYLNYEADMLEYVSATGDAGWSSFIPDPLSSGFCSFTMESADPYMAEMVDQEIMSVTFRLKLPLANETDYTTILSFSNAPAVQSFVDLSASVGCAEFVEIGDFSDLGSITLTDVVEYSAELASSPVALALGAPATVEYDIMVKNTFPIGMGTSADDKIRFNMVNIPSLAYISHTGENGMSFDHGDNGGYYSCEQEWSEIPSQRSWDISASVPTHRSTLKFAWVPTEYSPAWGQFELTPQFVATTATYGDTQAPDLEVPGFVANTNNEVLALGMFDPIPVNVAQIYSSDIYGNGCANQSFSIRSNFNITSFSFDIFVNGNFTLGNFHSSIPGVTFVRSTDQILHVSTNGSFTGIDASENLIFIGTVRHFCDVICTGVCKHESRISSASVAGRNGTSGPSVGQFAVVHEGSDDLECWTYCPPGIEKSQGDEIGSGGLPKEFALRQNFPNPFNPTTIISLDLPHSSEWTITIYNVTGQMIQEFGGYSNAGSIEVEWDASPYASGVYLYRVEAGEFSQSKKMMLIK